MGQQAQVLVVFAITAAAILAVIGLLYTLGLVLTQRRGLQSAADAASLSGSWTVLTELATDDRRDGQVVNSVVHFARSNGVPSDGTSADATYVSAVYIDGTGALLSPSTTVGSGGVFPLAARGVRVTVNNQIPTILPGFVGILNTVVRTSAASTAKPTTSLAAASYVVPIGVLLSDARAAFAAHSSYDLFAHPLPGGQAPTLDFTLNGAPTFGAVSMSTRLQYWSDGQHSGIWQLSQPSTVALAGGPYYDSVAAGLQDNVRRQGVTEATGGAAYALIILPVYDTPTSTSIHVIGFAQFKVRAADIKLTGPTWSASGTFVPYPASAWGVPAAPGLSSGLGSALIGLVP